jgi:hypothetical protein
MFRRRLNMNSAIALVTSRNTEGRSEMLPRNGWLPIRTKPSLRCSSCWMQCNGEVKQGWVLLPHCTLVVVVVVVVVEVVVVKMHG